MSHTIQQQIRLSAAHAGQASQIILKRLEQNRTLMNQSFEEAAEEMWNRVSDGLFNERGPWGTLGASAIIAKDPYLSPEETRRSVESTLYWSLDLSETSARTCIKLKRDPMGTNHEVSSSRVNTPRTSFSNMNLRDSGDHADVDDDVDDVTVT